MNYKIPNLRSDLSKLTDRRDREERFRQENSETLMEFVRCSPYQVGDRSFIDDLILIKQSEESHAKADARNQQSLDASQALHERVKAIEEVATRSQFLSWSFWFAFLALIISIFALLRDYFGWQRTAQDSATAVQSQIPNRKNEPQPPSSYAPTGSSTTLPRQPNTNTAMILNAPPDAGHTSTPPMMKQP